MAILGDFLSDTRAKIIHFSAECQRNVVNKSLFIKHNMHEEANTHICSFSIFLSVLNSLRFCCIVQQGHKPSFS